MGQSPSREHNDVKVVIVGAGYAGVSVASQLLGVCDICLVSPEEFFFHNAGTPRSCVEPDFAKNVMIPLKETFKDSFIKAKVVEINKTTNKVILDNGNEVEYTHLIVATGTIGPFPFRLCSDHPKISCEEGKILFDALVAEVEKADRVVCIGGGAVGVEVSGEVKYRYPNKTVTLIHSNNTLCTTRLKPSAQSKLQSRMRSKGIELMLNERVSNLDDLKFNEFVKDQVVNLQSGKTLEADIVFKCIGSTPATEIFRESCGEAINEKGLIQVDEFFKVKGSENIYAIGDITDIVEEKMVVTATAHADLIVQNIKAAINGKRMSPYKPGQFLMLIPLGKDAGVSQLYGLVFGDFMTSIIKGQNLFVDKMWGLAKLKPPKS